MSSFLFLLIFLFLPCVTLYFQSIFSSLVMEDKHDISSIGNHLGRYVRFSYWYFVYWYFCSDSASALSSRRLFSTLVMEGKQEFPAPGTIWDGMSIFIDILFTVALVVKDTLEMTLLYIRTIFWVTSTVNACGAPSHKRTPLLIRRRDFMPEWCPY